jgi:hypothetical protein
LNVFKELISAYAEAPVNPTDTEWRRAEWKIPKINLFFKRDRGHSLYTEKECCHAVSEPVQ